MVAGMCELGRQFPVRSTPEGLPPDAMLACAFPLAPASSRPSCLPSPSLQLKLVLPLLAKEAGVRSPRQPTHPRPRRGRDGQFEDLSLRAVWLWG